MRFFIGLAGTLLGLVFVEPAPVDACGGCCCVRVTPATGGAPPCHGARALPAQPGMPDMLHAYGGALAVADRDDDTPKKQPAKAEVTQAMYMVSGLHWGLCATALEGSLKKVKGIKSTKVNFNSKSAIITFEESVLSAQEVARAMSASQHMMGANMQYGGILLLRVPDAKDKATGEKAAAALRDVEGVAKVTFYPQQKAVAIEFADKGKVTTTQLIDALKEAGLKGAQYLPDKKK